MDNKDLFTAALQLEYPWKVSNVEFIPDEDDPKEMTLHITIALSVELSSSSTMRTDLHGQIYLANL